MLMLWNRFWHFVRHISGDDAYERYLAHHQNAHPQEKPLSRKAFYRQSQAKKWDGVKRCC